MRIQATNHRQNRKIEAKETTKRISILLGVFGASAILILLIGGAIGLLLVVRYYKEPEAVFEAVPKKTIKIPPKTPEHKMNVAKHEASKPKPVFTQKLMSTKPSEFALPDLPQVNLDQMLPLDPSELVTDQVSNLMGTSGLGNGMGNGLIGGGGTGSGTSFLGLKSQGSKILLIFDISTSVVSKADKAGIPFEKIKQQTIDLIEGLNPNMRFAIIQFSRVFRPYPPQLTVATKGNKENTIEWLNDNWKQGSLARSLSGVVSKDREGPLELLKHAWSMDPDVIYFISDGSFQITKGSNSNYTVPHDDIGKLIRELQSKSTTMGGVKFNFIGVGMKAEDESTMKKITRRNGGELREIK